MSKHTAGPWNNRGTDIHAIDNEGDEVVITDTSGKIMRGCAYGRPWREENLANAHLIAASPCMYEALKRLVTLDAERDSLHENTDRIAPWVEELNEAYGNAKVILAKASPLGGNDE